MIEADDTASETFQNTRLRVLLVGEDTAGFLTGLSEGFRSLGHRVELAAREDIFDYGLMPSTHDPGSALSRYQSSGLVTLFDRLPISIRDPLSRIFARGKRSNPVVRLAKYLEGQIRLTRVFPVLRQYQIIVYNQGRTVSGSRLEAFLVRKLTSAKVIIVFHGSDVRPAYLNGAVWRASPKSPRELRSLVVRQHSLSTWAERYAHLLVCWSGITHFFRREVHLHELLGFPLSVTTWRDTEAAVEGGSEGDKQNLRIVHLPSSPPAKGTPEIIQIVHELREEGFVFDFFQASDLSHKDALAKLRSADIVIDQVFSDTAAGVLSAESAIHKKPALIASKDRDWYVELLGARLPPTVFVNSHEFKRALIELLESEALRKELGQAGHEFFTAQWHPQTVAQNYLSAIGYLSGKTCVDPGRIVKPRGGYASPIELSEVVKRLVTAFGIRSLHLNHNPQLQENLLKEFDIPPMHRDPRLAGLRRFWPWSPS